MHSISFIPVLLALGAVARAATLVDRAFPHLLVPVVQDEPNVAKGTKFSGLVETKKGGHQVYTEFLFDVPVNDADICELNFFISMGPAGPWELQGNISDRGYVTLNISRLTSVPTVNDTWNSKPSVGDWVATIGVSHEGNVTVKGGDVPCVKDSTAQYIIYPGTTGDLHFSWVELDDPIHGVTYDMYKSDDATERQPEDEHKPEEEEEEEDECP